MGRHRPKWYCWQVFKCEFLGHKFIPVNNIPYEICERCFERGGDSIYKKK